MNKITYFDPEVDQAMEEYFSFHGGSRKDYALIVKRYQDGSHDYYLENIKDPKDRAFIVKVYNPTGIFAREIEPKKSEIESKATRRIYNKPVDDSKYRADLVDLALKMGGK